MLQSARAARMCECHVCGRDILRGEMSYGNRCASCGVSYNSGYTACEKAAKADVQPSDLEQHEDMRAIMRELSGSKIARLKRWKDLCMLRDGPGLYGKYHAEYVELCEEYRSEGVLAKPDEPKAVDKNGEEELVWIERPTQRMQAVTVAALVDAAIRLKVLCPGIPDRINAMIRGSRWWEAVLAAVQADLSQADTYLDEKGKRMCAEDAFQIADAVLAEADKRGAFEQFQAELRHDWENARTDKRAGTDDVVEDGCGDEVKCTPITPGMCRDLLGLVDVTVTLDRCTSWTPKERKEAFAWADAVYDIANDNEDVDVSRKPKHVPLTDTEIRLAEKLSKPEPELAGTDEYPKCGLCNTLLDPDDQSYCSSTHCQRYPGPEVIAEKRAGGKE